MMRKTSPPVLSVSGRTLTWTPSPNRRRIHRDDYRVASKAPGQRAWTTVLLEDLTNLAYTPPVVPGATVRYKVKASYAESVYSNEVTITYPLHSRRRDSGRRVRHRH